MEARGHASVALTAQFRQESAWTSQLAMKPEEPLV